MRPRMEVVVLEKLTLSGGEMRMDQDGAFPALGGGWYVWPRIRLHGSQPRAHLRWSPQ